MPQPEPSRRQIVTEILIYALLFVLVGALFAATRMALKGEGVLDYDPHATK